MIKGSTKVGEIFLCGPETSGELDVLNQFLGKAITGLGGGCKKMFVIEGKFIICFKVLTFTFDDIVEGDIFIGEIPGAVSSIAVDQKIEERESLRHSTHRSQRSDRATGNVVQPGAQGAAAAQQNMQRTASDRFGQTEYHMSETQKRPAFQKGGASLAQQRAMHGHEDMDGGQAVHDEQRFMEQQ